MQMKFKSSAGWLTMLAGLPAMAQDTAARFSAATNCASCPPPGNTGNVVIPSDPTWFIAGLGVGLLLGVIGTWVLDLRKRR
jgi:hypothetical protein